MRGWLHICTKTHNAWAEYGIWTPECFLHRVCDDEPLYMFTSISLLLAVSMVRSVLVVSVATFA